MVRQANHASAKITHPLGRSAERAKLTALARRLAKQTRGLADPQAQADLLLLLRGVNAIQPAGVARLTEVEVADICRRAIQFAQRQGDGSPDVCEFTRHGLAHDCGMWEPGSWRLAIESQDPVRYRLTVPAWIRLTADRSGSVRLSVRGEQDRMLLLHVGRSWRAILGPSTVPAAATDAQQPTRRSTNSLI